MLHSLRLNLGILLGILLISSSITDAKDASTNTSVPRKIVVVWSKGGQAHTSMLKALEEGLAEVGTVMPLNPFDTLWTTDDIGGQTVNTFINDLASLFNVPPLNGKAVYNLLRHRDLGSSFSLSFEIAKWLGKSPKNTFKLLYSYKDLIQEHLSSLTDTINQIANKGGEDFYNFLLQNNQIELANKLFKQSAQDIIANQELLVERFKDFFIAEKPDLVISVMPLFNTVIYKATEALEIPFLLIAPDFDISEHYFPGLTSQTHTYFKYTLPVQDAVIERKIEKAGIQKQQATLYGFPLRSHFFEPKNKKMLKEQFSIPKDKPVIMLMAGGSGSSKMRTYIEHLMNSAYPIHIIACTGNNRELAQELEEYTWQLPDHVTLTNMPFTEKTSDLMAVADILITKPGPTSLCEAFQMQLPLVIDATSPLLNWEKSHVTFAEKHRLGKVIRHINELDEALDTLLHNKKYQDQLKTALKRFDNTLFIDKLKELIVQSINESEKDKNDKHNDLLKVASLFITAALAAALKQVYLS